MIPIQNIFIISSLDRQKNQFVWITILLIINCTYHEKMDPISQSKKLFENGPDLYSLFFSALMQLLIELTKSKFKSPLISIIIQIRNMLS